MGFWRITYIGSSKDGGARGFMFLLAVQTLHFYAVSAKNLAK